MDSREEALNALEDLFDSYVTDETFIEGYIDTKHIETIRKALQQPDQIITDNSKVNYNALARIKGLEEILHNQEHSLPNDKDTCESYKFISIHRYKDGGYGLTTSGDLPSGYIAKVLSKHGYGEMI